jgi:hypothetical protein
MMSPRIRAFHRASSVACLLAAASAYAAPVAWTGAAGDNLWHTPGNWSPVGIPGAADDVTIDVAGTPTILFNATTGTRSVNSLVLNEKLTMSGGKLTVVSTADVNANITFTSGGEIAGGSWDFSGGSLSGNANINNRVSDLALVGPAIIQGGGTWIRFKNVALSGQLTVSNNTLLAFDGNQTIPASGTLVLQNGSYVGMSPAGTLTVAPGATIRGACSLFTTVLSSNCTLINQGTIEADGASLDVAAATIVNTGLIKTSGGVLSLGTPTCTLSGNGSFNVSAGTLLLRGTFPTSAVKNFNRTGGTVTFQGTMNNAGDSFTFNNSTGQWQFSSGVITGGTLSFADGQTIAANGSIANKFRDLTIVGDASITGSGTWLQLSNVTFAGTFSIGSNTLLAFDGNQSLSTGTIAMAEGSFLNCNPGGTLTIGPAASIRGRGQLGTTVPGTPTIINNQGSIVAEGTTGELGVFAMQLNNSGTIRVAPGATMRRANPSLAGTTAFTNAGTIQLDAGSTLRFELTSNNLSSGTLSIDLKGPPSASADYGRILLASGSTLNIGDTLKINEVNGYQTTCGLGFPIIAPVANATNTSLTGTFATLDVAPPDFGNYQVVRYTSNSAEYQILTAADFDNDGFISFEDFDAFVAAFEEGLQTSDFDQDGFLTFEDFDAFVAKFEGGC